MKVPVLGALGVDPETGATEALAWVRGTAESAADWEQLLTLLYERGVHHAAGLRLFIHDGSGGLDAAQARERLAAFRVKWQEKEEKAVQTLERDFELTLTCYTVREEARAAGHDWPLSRLRTTSVLERGQRSLQCKCRQAGAYRSDAGQTGAFWLVIRQRERQQGSRPTVWLAPVPMARLAPHEFASKFPQP